jgi:deoxyribodipyrimidine photo-lyase
LPADAGQSGPIMHKFDKALVWFRRDLRIFDHTALFQAMRDSRTVWCVFVFDSDILDPLRKRGLIADRRVEFILQSLGELDDALRRRGGGLITVEGRAALEIPGLAERLQVDAVFANHDYEPQAAARDAEVARSLSAVGRHWRSCKDQVVFEKNEILSGAGRPFSVFTPYKNAWLRRLEQSFAEDPHFLAPGDIEVHAGKLARPEPPCALPSLEKLGFAPTDLQRWRIPTGMSGAHTLFNDFLGRIGAYADARDFPAINGTSFLSVHLRFGTLSVRRLVRAAWELLHGPAGTATAGGASVWLSELIWREFYFMILHHRPDVVERCFRPEYARIEWESGDAAEQAFSAWCEGRTGYPLVDAAMLQLNRTGYMHNRLRMVSASFLVKDLGIDWRRGERYFADRLIDFDLAANNGGWQWVASCGCDAQPWFRIFNPITQSERFDPDGGFIRHFLPQLARLNRKEIHAPWLLSPARLAEAGLALGKDYPPPLVLHEAARKRTLERYAVVKAPG